MRKMLVLMQVQDLNMNIVKVVSRSHLVTPNLTRYLNHRRQEE